MLTALIYLPNTQLQNKCWQIEKNSKMSYMSDMSSGKIIQHAVPKAQSIFFIQDLSMT